MRPEEILQLLRTAPRQTPVKLYLWEKAPVEFPGCRVFQGGPGCRLVFGNWADIGPVLQAHGEQILDMQAECDCRNSALPMLDLRSVSARVEPGAMIRAGAVIGENAVIMMGAIINIGAIIGPGTMVDMGAVIGGRAQVGQLCHIGAGAVLAGVIEPACARPVVVGDGVLIGANAVILEGCRVGTGAVVAAGAVVTEDVPPGVVVAGCPARFVKRKDPKTLRKTALTPGLREEDG